MTQVAIIIIKFELQSPSESSLSNVVNQKKLKKMNATVPPPRKSVYTKSTTNFQSSSFVGASIIYALNEYALTKI